MKLQPTLNRVVIKPESEFVKTKLVIPSVVKNLANVGEVIAVGPGRRHIDGKVYEPSTKVGSRVLFDRTRAMPFESEGDKLFLIEDEFIIAVLEADPTTN